MQSDVEGLVEAVVLLEVRPLRGPGDEDQVAGGRDREELGQSLDEPEHERLEVGEPVGIVAHAGEGEDERESEGRARNAVDEGAAHGRILRRRRERQRAHEFVANCVKEVKHDLDPVRRVQ